MPNFNFFIRRIATFAQPKTAKLPNFHHAFPVFDLDKTRDFYVNILKCPQGREEKGHWIDFSLFGHQIVAHKVPSQLQKTVEEYRISMSSMVDGHNVPIPHFGCVLEWGLFDDFSIHLKNCSVKFEIEPYIRFEGLVGEQRTMFFKDPSGNALEFKTFKDIDKELFNS